LGGPITSTALSHILQNPIYIAKKEVNRPNRDLTPEENASLPDGDRYRLEDAVWEPILEIETFERVGEMLAENYARRKNTVAVVDYNYVLQRSSGAESAGRPSTRPPRRTSSATLTGTPRAPGRPRVADPHTTRRSSRVRCSIG
jgi:hypothetical protein